MVAILPMASAPPVMGAISPATVLANASSWYQYDVIPSIDSSTSVPSASLARTRLPSWGACDWACSHHHWLNVASSAFCSRREYLPTHEIRKAHDYEFD